MSDEKNDFPTDDVEAAASAVDAPATPPEDAAPPESGRAEPETGAPEEEEPEVLYTRRDVERLLAEASDRHLRLAAEYDNFRRRTQREKEQWMADALEAFVKDLLPVFDSFDKARESATGELADVQAGLDVTHRQLRGALARCGIEVIDPAAGEAFDPRVHEAVMRRPAPEQAAGSVVTVFERGYKLGPRLLRPARTVVAAEE